MKVWVGAEHILKEVCRAQDNTLSLGFVEQAYNPHHERAKFKTSLGDL